MELLKPARQFSTIGNPTIWKTACYTSPTDYNWVLNMLVLWDLIETPLYKYLNVIIHHQQVSLFALHMNLEFQIFIYNNASFNNFNSKNA
jgi:hypothetical protein